MDVEARQLALQYLKRAEQADTQATALLEAARKANKAVALNPTNAEQARRATLAREAYNARMNAEVGRVMAAFALLAEREGTRAQTARQVLSKVQDAQRQEVLVESAKGGELRRNIMLQAAQAAEKALQSAPGLPAFVVDNKMSAGADQMTVGASGFFRPSKVQEVQGSFFPADVRAAAGSLRGLGWTDSFLTSIENDAKAVADEAKRLADEVAAQEPGSAGLSQEAGGLIARLRIQYNREMPTGQHPWLHMAGAVAATLLILKVLK